MRKPNSAVQQEALNRAVQSQAMTNLPTIYTEFMERGIPESEIRPRENVFTFHAWKALGRSVRRGEHGVRILTWIPVPEVQNDDGTVRYKASKRCKTAYVFHVSQTDPIGYSKPIAPVESAESLGVDSEYITAQFHALKADEAK